MISDLFSAAVRAMLVALLVATPALLLPQTSADVAQFTTVLAILSGLLILIEYLSRFPSIVEFRFAPPYNRTRFVGLFICVALITVILRSSDGNIAENETLIAIGSVIATALDFPFSPVQLFVSALPDTASAPLIEITRLSCGIAYFVSLMTIMSFYVSVRFFDWPFQDGTFNIFTNLPRFDPTGGGDVLHKIKRSSNINMFLGVCLPFIIPIGMKIASEVLGPLSLTAPQTIIWTISLWAMIPATMIMRGIAMGRLAMLIEDKRKRAYARAQETRLQPS